MDRASIYYIDNPKLNTFSYDESLPPVPLPELRDTLQRYYESLKPFGTAEELDKTREIIADFENGVGAQLQAKLKEHVASKKDWLGEWWEAYSYHMLRFPLNPYIVMAMPVKFDLLGVPETAEHLLKNLARMTYHTIEFWDLLRKAKLKPLITNGGKTKHSSALYKRFFSTTRVPGVEIDHIERHFKTAAEGATPTHGLISGKGRLFIFDTVHADGSIVTPQELLIIMQRVRSILDYEPLGDCVPVLTHDQRTAWANNRQHLREISASNCKTLKLVESSNVVVAFDEHEPKDYEEIAQLSIYGDYHSKWGDRSSTIIAYKNGKFACVGEHSAYDGTVSVSYEIYIQLSVFEVPEPDWTDMSQTQVIQLNEMSFDLDDTLRNEIKRVLAECDSRGTDVIVTHKAFHDYGKNFIKQCKLHPDSFVQVIMQWAYARLHNAIAPTYETALMRHYYNGRTETLRSCTNEVHKFIQIATDPSAAKAEIVQAFRNAAQHHNYMMNEARNGHGVDRHLFGLWCTANEQKLDIPDFYSDPLYAKSGGGGNFVLSTSTLGNTVNVGFVAPMVLDGYGVFYTITSNVIFIQTTAFRESSVTSAHNFNEMFQDSFRKIKSLLDDVKNSKL